MSGADLLDDGVRRRRARARRTARASSSTIAPTSRGSPGADGVHVGQDDLPPAAVRAVVGADAIVGLSTHTTAQIDRAACGAGQLRRDRTGVRHRDEGDRLRPDRARAGRRGGAPRRRPGAAAGRDRRDHARNGAVGARGRRGVGGRHQRPARDGRPGGARAGLSSNGSRVRRASAYNRRVFTARRLRTERVHSGWSIVSDEINRSPHGRRRGNRRGDAEADAGPVLAGHARHRRHHRRRPLRAHRGRHRRARPARR